MVNLMIQSEEFLARNLFSIVVGAHSDVGGVGHTKGGGSNSMSSTSMFQNRNPGVGDRNSSVGGRESSVGGGESSVGGGRESSISGGESSVGGGRESSVDVVGRDTMDGYKRIGLTLDNMLNSMVLGDVLGSKGSIRLSSVVAGAVVVGDLVGDRSDSTVGNRADNMATSSVGKRVDHRVHQMAASSVGNRADNRLKSRVCAHWKSRISSQGGNSRMVDNSRVSLSLSIPLANGVDIRVVVRVVCIIGV